MDQAENRFYRKALGQTNDGGPAFPVNDQTYAHRVGAAAIDGVTDTAERDRLYIEASTRAVAGMSLRDYFAAVALPALQARYYGETECGDLDIAGMAYDQADAMLQRRVDPDSPPPAHYRNALAQIANGATGYSDNDTTLANIAKRALGMEVDE